MQFTELFVPERAIQDTYRSCLSTEDPDFRVNLGPALLSPDSLLRALTSHPTYQRVANEFLQPEEASSPLANGKAVNNNGNVHNGNGSLHYDKKLE